MEKEIKNLIQRIDEKGDIFPMEDGYQYYDAGNGCLSSWMLRAIADELDRRNEDWDNQIHKYFEGQEKTDGTI